MENIRDLELFAARYHPLTAISYIPTPEKLQNKYAILTLPNIENKCLVWSLLAQKHSIEDKNNHSNKVFIYAS